MAEYPTETELKVIETWNLVEQGVERLIDFIEEKWWMSDWGFLREQINNPDDDTKKILKLNLSTGGWSGNEDLIDALKGNFLFWSLYWTEHRKGGHYKFEIKLD